jgi:SAM-dependent methyltransferase
MELNRLYSPGCLAETKRQYRESERASGKSWAEQHAINPSTQDRLKSISKPYRSKRLYDVVSSITPPSDIRKILDFGAQTGDMTECFSGGVQRYVYDKDLSAVVDQSVIPLRSFSAVEASGPYDLIVLSHVLEHVPFPADLLGELRRHLSETGLLYVEVPIEYCGAIIKRQGIPLGAHINYFCRSSLSACLNVAGFNRMAARREIVPYGECQIPALKMVACRNKGRPGASCHRPWWIDLIVDALLILRVRKWPKRFD